MLAAFHIPEMHQRQLQNLSSCVTHLVTIPDINIDVIKLAVFKQASLRTFVDVYRRPLINYRGRSLVQGQSTKGMERGKYGNPI